VLFGFWYTCSAPPTKVGGAGILKFGKRAAFAVKISLLVTTLRRRNEGASLCKDLSAWGGIGVETGSKESENELGIHSTEETTSACSRALISKFAPCN
jgi:hypothetical protein